MSVPMPRDASGYMTYPTNCTVSILAATAAGTRFGPNDMGEWMWPVSAEYDSASDSTRVGFTLVPPHDKAVSQ